MLILFIRLYFLFLCSPVSVLYLFSCVIVLPFAYLFCFFLSLFNFRYFSSSCGNFYYFSINVVSTFLFHVYLSQVSVFFCNYQFLPTTVTVSDYLCFLLFLIPLSLFPFSLLNHLILFFPSYFSNFLFLLPSFLFSFLLFFFLSFRLFIYFLPSPPLSGFSRLHVLFSHLVSSPAAPLVIYLTSSSPLSLVYLKEKEEERC